MGLKSAARPRVRLFGIGARGERVARAVAARLPGIDLAAGPPPFLFGAADASAEPAEVMVVVYGGGDAPHLTLPAAARPAALVTGVMVHDGGGQPDSIDQAAMRACFDNIVCTTDEAYVAEMIEALRGSSSGYGLRQTP